MTPIRLYINIDHVATVRQARRTDEPDPLEAARMENEALRRKLESRKLVDRAKGLLMTRLGMSEPEAFRRIQKTAMDTRKPMAEVAQALLLTEEMGHARAAKL